MRLALPAEGWLLAHGAPLGPTPALHACGTVAREGWPWTCRAIPQPWAREAMFVPKAQGFAPQPRSPAAPAPSHRRVLFSQPALLSHPEIGTAEILQEMKKKTNKPKVPLKANYHWQVCAVIGLGLYQIFPFAEA